MKYRKKPVVIEAYQWTENGCLPWDESELITVTAEPFLSEGKCVRYFRRPDISGDTLCKHCELVMHFHGWIDTLEGGHIVCPNDYIIKGVKGEFYPCKPDIFEMTYEAAE